MTGSGRPWLRALPALLVALAATAVPLASVLVELPSAASGWSAPFEDGPLLDRLVFTLVQALASTTIGLVVGVAASWLLARQRGLLGLLLTAPLLVPVALPPIVLASGIELLSGGEVVPEALVIQAHALFTFGACIWLLTPVWGAPARRVTDEVRLLSGSRTLAFRLFTWPAVRSTLFLVAALGFVHAVTAVPTVMLLGDPEHWTLEATLLEEGASGIDPAIAVTALVQFALGVVVLAAYPAWPLREGGRAPRTPMLARVAGGIALALLAVAVVLPFAAVVAEVAGLEGVPSEALPGGDEHLRWSLIYAVTSGLAATAFAWCAAPLVAAARRGGVRRRLLAVLLILPIAISPVVLALGTRAALEAADVDLEATWAVMVAVHAVIAYPLAARILTIPPRADSLRLREASMLLGQSARRARWTWEGQRMLRAAAASVLICASISIGEVAAATLIAPVLALPLGVSLLEELRASGAEAAPGVFWYLAVIGVCAVVAFLAGEWLRRGAARLEAR